MPNLEKLLEYGICEDVVFGPCEHCDFNFDYEGQYYSDTPYPACDVLRAIIHEAKRRKEAKK